MFQHQRVGSSLKRRKFVVLEVKIHLFGTVRLKKLTTPLLEVWLRKVVLLGKCTIEHNLEKTV